MYGVKQRDMALQASSRLGTSQIGGLALAKHMTAAGLFGIQVIRVLAVVDWAAILTFMIIRVVGVRVSEEVEIEGLGITVHGECGYELQPATRWTGL